MKVKFRRVLSIVLTLCMVLGMMPGRTVVSQAAPGTTNYNIFVEFPGSSNYMVPNSMMYANVYLERQNSDGTELLDNGYTVEVVSVEKIETSDPDPNQLISVNIQNGITMVVTSNTNSLTGKCSVTLAAKMDGVEVARTAFAIMVMGVVYEVPHVLMDSSTNNNVNPALGEKLDLENVFELQKVTYDPNNGSVSYDPVNWKQPPYNVSIEYDTNEWTKDGTYNLIRTTGENTEITVKVFDGNGGSLAQHIYKFSDLGLDVSWVQSMLPNEVYKDDTADFYLNVDMQGYDYDVVCTFGVGPWNQNNILNNPNKPLYSKLTDQNGKVNAIRVDGPAIAEVCNNGEFWIKVEAYAVVNSTKYKASETYTNVPFLEPDYSVMFNGNFFSVFNTDLKKEMYLDTRNISDKNYDIKFTIGNYNPVDGFTAFPANIQSELFERIKDVNNGNKVVGLALNGAAISSVCDNSQFEVNVVVLINGEKKYETNQTVYMNKTSYWMDIIWNGDWPITVYEDDTSEELLLDLSSLSNLSNYDLEFELGTFGSSGPDSYAPLTSQAGLFTKVMDNGQVVGICLDAAAVRQVYSGEELIIKVDVQLGGYTISTSHMGIMLGSTAPSYEYGWFDTDALIEEGWPIGPKLDYVVRNSQNPDGIWGEVDVVDVTVQPVSGATDAVKVEKDGDIWEVKCNAIGEAKVTITHKTVDGGTASYSFTVNSVDSVWDSGFWNADMMNNVIPGDSISFEAFAVNKRWTQGVGIHKADTPFEIEWFATCDPSLAQDVNIVYLNANNTSIRIDVAATAEETDYDFGYYVYELDDNGNRVTDGSGNAFPVFEGFGRVVIMSDFPYLKLDGYTRDFEAGETITVKPIPTRRYLDGTTIKEEVLQGATYTYQYDPDTIEFVDNQDGTYTVTRLAGWEIDSCWITVEAPYANGPWRNDGYLYFPEIDYSVSYKSLRGQDDTTWMYDNEEYTLEVDTSSFAGKRTNLALEWLVIEWIDVDNDIYNEITTGFTVDGNKIILNGAELAAQDLESLEIIALVTSNGHIIYESAYTDLELLRTPAADDVDTSTPVTNVTPVVGQEAMNTAVKEVVAAVDKVHDAVLSGEIVVDAEGKLDKLPTALEGVISKETAEAIIKAKENGATIAVEVVTQNLTRDDAVALAAEDVAKIEDEIPSKDKIAQFLNLEVMIKANYSDGSDEELGTLNKLESEAMTFVIVIPNELLSKGKDFYVLRAHDGVVDKLPTTQNADGTLSFTTDKYSTYVLAYEEVVNYDDDDDDDDSYVDTTSQSTPVVTIPVTGDNSNFAVWMTMLVLAGVCMVYVILFDKKRANNNK